MPQATREIKRRIKSIKSTRQITKAMEMVSVVKMRKAVDAVLKTRRYSELAWEIVTNLSKTVEAEKHPLLVKREEKRVGLVVISSNRGLCGGFNAQLINTINDFIKKVKQEKKEVDIIVFGRKGREAMYKFGYNVIAEFEKMDVTTRIAEILPLARLVVDDYINEKYDKVAVAYTDYVSSLVQQSRVRAILPISKKDTELGAVGVEKEDDREAKEEKTFGEYIFEPSDSEVLIQVIPRLIETQLFQTVLESNASEHAARMMAMKNATDAADDMITDLTFNFNQARQASITQEIAEISGGKIALERLK